MAGQGQLTSRQLQISSGILHLVCDQKVEVEPPENRFYSWRMTRIHSIDSRAGPISAAKVASTDPTMKTILAFRISLAGGQLAMAALRPRPYRRTPRPN
jgi:hypothetical protein